MKTFSYWIMERKHLFHYILQCSKYKELTVETYSGAEIATHKGITIKNCAKGIWIEFTAHKLCYL